MFHIRVIKRQEPLGIGGSCLVLLSALVLSLLLSGLLLFLRGTPPIDGIVTLFQGAFGTRWAIEDSILKAIPIFLCSLGVAIAFRLQVWNIGAEGQFALGAIGATWVALSFPEWPKAALLPAMIFAAVVAGGGWGLIPALLRQRLKTNEIIVTLMMNYIAILFLQYLVYGVWKDPESFGFPMTPAFSEQAIVGKIQTNLPIVFTMSFDTNGRTMMGVGAADMMNLHQRLGVHACGTNCGIGAAEVVAAILNMRSSKPDSIDDPILIAKANCGIPEFIDGEIHYNGTPKIMARYATMARDAGARIVGGCCGTSPEHVAAMRYALDSTAPGPVPSIDDVNKD